MTQDATPLYRAVVNDEGQYSIWPTGKEIPRGWRESGETGKHEDVLRYIGAVWVDMRPISVRRQLMAVGSDGLRVDHAKQTLRGGVRERSATEP